MPAPDSRRWIRAAKSSSPCRRAPAPGCPAAASPRNKRAPTMGNGAHGVARAATGDPMPAHAGIGSPTGLGARAGIGLRAHHHLRVLSDAPAVAWFEAHTENYFADGGPRVEALARTRANRPLPLHGVGPSLGSADPLYSVPLGRARRAVSPVDPARVC